MQAFPHAIFSKSTLGNDKKPFLKYGNVLAVIWVRVNIHPRHLFLEHEPGALHTGFRLELARSGQQLHALFGVYGNYAAFEPNSVITLVLGSGKCRERWNNDPALVQSWKENVLGANVSLGELEQFALQGDDVRLRRDGPAYELINAKANFC